MTQVKPFANLCGFNQKSKMTSRFLLLYHLLVGQGNPRLLTITNICDNEHSQCLFIYFY